MNNSARTFALLEVPRALAEMASIPLSIPLLSQLPRGDGHGVFVIPGLTASDKSTYLLRRFLDEKGYRSIGWDMGRNMGLERSGGIEVLSKKLTDFYNEMGGKVSIIGWSLGGVHARKLARLHPKLIRQVIYLGSPINVQILNQQSAEKVINPSTIEVPCTSIYSKSDGIVPWEMSLETDASQHDNIEIVASHIGLGANPSVFYIIANRLALTDGDWRPFDTESWRNRMALAMLNPIGAAIQSYGRMSATSA